MANSDKNILITPSVGLSTNPTIKFNGANNTPTTLRVLDDGTVSFEGTAGQLFSVADGMTGTIFSVNDVSGIPNIEVLDTALVKLNQYQGQSVFGSSAAISNTAGNPAQVSIVPKNQITPGLIIKHAPENTATITSITGSGSAVTYTALNTFSAGTYVTITGANPSAYNLTNAYIGNATSTQFTVSSTATGTYVSGGTATTVGPSNLNPIFEIQSSSGSSIFSIETSANNPTVKAFLFRANYFGASDNTITVGSYAGTYDIMGSTAASTILKVTGAPSQTANLQEWQSSTGNVLAKIQSTGAFNSSWAGTFGALSNLSSTTLGVVALNSTIVPLVVKGAASQTANLQEWQNSAGTVLARIDNTGNAIFIDKTVYANQVYVGNGNYLNATMHNVSGGAAEMRLLLRAHPSQTANIQEWQDSAATVLARVDANGSLISPIVRAASLRGGDWVNAPSGLWATSSVSATASTIGLIVKGAASQTANLQEWQDSTGTVLINVSSAGNFSANSSLTQAARFRYFDNPAIDGAYIDTRLVAGTLGVVARSTTATTLSVRGVASQTADLQQWQNSAGTVLAKVNQSGEGTFSGKVSVGSDMGSALNVLPYTASQTGAIVRGAPSQTANLQEWQRSDGFVLLNVSKDGDVTAGSGSSTAIRFRYFDGVAASGTYWDTVATNSATFNGRSTTAATMVIKGAASQTANLQEWQNSAGTVLAKIAADGAVSLASGGVDIHGAGANFTIRNAGTTAWYLNSSLLVGTGYSAGIGVIIRGNGSQTADLQQWQYSDGNTYARIAPYGQLAIGNVNPAIYANARISLNTVAADAVGMVIRGVSSQTANLQEWQDSAGTVVARVSSVGDATFKENISTVNNGIRLRDGVWGTNSGVLQLRKGSASTVPGAGDYLQLGVVAGTTAGTLKLVVRAGTAGAETTILDNIPQS